MFETQARSQHNRNHFRPFAHNGSGTIAQHAARAGARRRVIDESDMPGQAVILAGGLGTRLRPYTTVIPKPLVPIGDRPVLQHIVDSLSRDGVRRVDLCVSHLGELIKLYFAQTRSPTDLDVVFHPEDEPLGTAGALRLIPDLEDTFIVMNGDVLTSLDYGELWRYHKEQGATLTVAMQAKRVQIDLGVIQHSGGYVSDYIEKPTMDYHVSMGIYVYERRAIDFLPEGPCQFPELVWRLLAANEPVAAYLTEADWYDIGTVEEYERASEAVELDPAKFGMEPASTPAVSSVQASGDGESESSNGDGGSPSKGTNDPSPIEFPLRAVLDPSRI
jgi:NDP-sugar pyrophosphorylase family protein